MEPKKILVCAGCGIELLPCDHDQSTLACFETGRDEPVITKMNWGNYDNYPSRR